MKGLSFAFLAAGAISVTIGMAWGIQMSASHDHSLAPAHAHLNLLGWVSFAIFGFFYHLVPQAAQGVLPRLHFSIALAGLVTLVPGIVLALTNGGDTLAKIGSVLSLASMLLFVWIVFRSVRQNVPNAAPNLA